MTALKEPTVQENGIAEKVLDAAFLVHREMGPGLLESVYEACLINVLTEQDFLIERQKDIPVHFRGKKMGLGFRADLIINRTVLVELKSVEKLLRLHEAQIINYLKLSNIKLGLLLNFNAPLMKDGIKRFVLSK